MAAEYRNGELFFDAEEYWRDKEYKKWVVRLSKGSGKKEQSRVYNIQARTIVRAIAAAKAYSVLTGRVRGEARLATPADLGATMAVAQHKETRCEA